MQQVKQWFVVAVFAFVTLQPFATASAATVYQVSVDTSSLYGTTGYLDLQFNPGDVTSPSATATLRGFSGDVTLDSGAVVDGSASGALPGTLSFGNDTPFNAALQPVTFSNVFGFTISFSGAYETAVSGSGTRFSLALLDPAYDPLATVDPVGTILQFELMPGGAVAATTFNADAFGAESIVTLTAVPVPAALPLLASAFALFGFARRRAI
jgi:hypothetical protein